MSARLLCAVIMAETASCRPAWFPVSPVESTFASRFRARDRGAHLEAYRLFAERVRSVVRRFFASPFEQEDAIQEIWLVVYKNASSYESAKGDLAGWIWTVASNRCREILRSQGRRLDPLLVADPDQALGGPLSPGTPVPELTLRDTRLRDGLVAYLATLPTSERAVFQMSCLEDRSLEDVARAMGLSVRQCKYLRMKLLAGAAQSPLLKVALEEMLER